MPDSRKTDVESSVPKTNIEQDAPKTELEPDAQNSNGLLVLPTTSELAAHVQRDMGGKKHFDMFGSSSENNSSLSFA